jgi:replication-associated recombination protein RarA
MPLYGHDSLRVILEADLPRVTLLTGFPSIGKWTLAEHLRWKHGFEGMDVLRIHKLTADHARSVVEFAERASIATKKLAIVRLDNATDRAQTILLKALEDTECVFILISSTGALRTIRSRSEEFRLGMLDRDTLAQVVRSRTNLGEAASYRLADIGHGQVKRALNALDSSKSKGLVVRVLMALHEHDAEGLEHVALKWDDSATELLRIWATEAITQRWAVFTKEESLVVGINLPLKLLMALKPNLRPKLVVRSTLMAMI